MEYKHVFFKVTYHWTFLDELIKSYLPCSKRSENLINRKVSIFYIEAVLNFFFQLQKIFFFGPKKFRPKKFSIKKFSTKFSTIFFDSQKIFFSELKKKLGIASTQKCLIFRFMRFLEFSGHSKAVYSTE